MSESRSARDRARLPGPPAAKPERQTQLEYAEADRVRADQPHERKRAGAGCQHRQDAEDDRQDAVQRQPSLARDPATEPDGGSDLQDARKDRPRGDHVEQRELRQAGERKRDDPSGDAEEALEEQRPPRLVVAATTDGGEDVEDARDERVAAEEQDQHG